MTCVSRTQLIEACTLLGLGHAEDFMPSGTTLQSLTSSTFHVRGQNKDHVL